MDKFKRALHDPQGVYHSPSHVLDDETLTREQKIQILHQWEYDARDIQVADEENMTGKSCSMLEGVLKALLKLGVEINTESPTKQGGE